MNRQVPNRWKKGLDVIVHHFKDDVHVFDLIADTSYCCHGFGVVVSGG
jgi:hypothetical protein